MLLQVVANEHEVLVPARVSGNAPLLAVLGQVAVAEQDSVEPCVVLGQSVDRHDLRRNREADVIADFQLTGIGPLRCDLAFGDPVVRALARLLERHAAKRPERMAVGDLDRRQRMLDVDRDHRIVLFVDELVR